MTEMRQMNNQQRALDGLFKMASGIYDFELGEYYFFLSLVERLVDGLSYDDVCTCLVKLIDNGLYKGEADNIVDGLADELLDE